MKNPTLILSSEDNRLYVFDMPEKPDQDFEDDPWAEAEANKNHHNEVKSAIANKVLVKDQLLAENELTYQHFKNKKVYILVDTHYQLSGYNVTIKFNCWNEMNPCHPLSYCGNRKLCDQVAILTPIESSYNSNAFTLEEQRMAVSCAKLGVTVEFREALEAAEETLKSRVVSEVEITEGNELEELREWKRQQMEVWSPVLDFCHDNSEKLGIKLGSFISKFILEILKSTIEGNGGWISDRMPEKNKAVNITAYPVPSFWNYPVTVGSFDGQEWVSEDDHSLNYEGSKIFWQPLPDMSKLNNE